MLLCTKCEYHTPSLLFLPKGRHLCYPKWLLTLLTTAPCCISLGCTTLVGGNVGVYGKNYHGIIQQNLCQSAKRSRVTPKVIASFHELEQSILTCKSPLITAGHFWWRVNWGAKSLSFSPFLMSISFGRHPHVNVYCGIQFVCFNIKIPKRQMIRWVMPLCISGS